MYFNSCRTIFHLYFNLSLMFRKNHARAMDSMQASLESEQRAKAEALRYTKIAIFIHKFMFKITIFHLSIVFVLYLLFYNLSKIEAKNAIFTFFHIHFLNSISYFNYFISSSYIFFIHIRFYLFYIYLST